MSRLDLAESGLGFGQVPGARGVLLDEFEEEVFGDRAGGGPAVICLAFLGAFDHDRNCDLRIFHRSKTNKPSEVYFFAMGTEIGGAGFTGYTELVDADETSGSIATCNAFHPVPKKGALTRGEVEPTWAKR